MDAINMTPDSLNKILLQALKNTAFLIGAK